MKTQKKSTGSSSNPPTKEVSQAVASFLIKEKLMTRSEIANTAKTSVAYLNKVIAGDGVFKPEHMNNLCEKVDDLYLEIIKIIAKEKASKYVGKGKKVYEKAARKVLAKACDLLSKL